MSKAVSATVEYGRTVKPADYESKAAKVAFTIVPQDEDSFITVADVKFWLETAQDLVLVKVGVKKAEPPVVQSDTAAKDAAKQVYADKEADKEAAVINAVKEADAKPKRTRKAKETEEELPLSVASSENATSPKEDADPTGDTADDPLAILSAGEDEAPVTAGEMTKAITAKVVAYQKAGVADGGKRVTALILKHSPDKKLTQPNVILKAIEEHNQGRLFLEALEGLE